VKHLGIGTFIGILAHLLVGNTLSSGFSDWIFAWVSLCSK